MKFTFNPAPNFRCKLSTKQIMFELLIGLLVVFGFALFYYGSTPAYGMTYVLQAIKLLAVALVSAYATEILWCLATKQNIMKFLDSSFPFITAIIFTLMLPISTALYAVVVSVVVAILFGKLVFGGFGHNIFNPAALGRAVIFAAFAKLSTDVVTAATPTTLMASQYKWLVTDAGLVEQLMSEVGGLGNLFVGMYPGAIGETSALVIGLVGIVLAFRKVIDWRVPVVFISTVFVLTTGIALYTGMGMWYPMFHILSGGLMFGAIFMATDPVTSPTSAAGRCIFAMGCGIITVLIRVKANLPEGVLYSILIMNALSPMIERFLDGEQRKLMKKFVIGFTVTGLLGLGSVILAISQVEPAKAVEPEVLPPSEPVLITGISDEALLNTVATILEVTDQDNGSIYKVSVNGYATMSGGADNVILVEISNEGKVVSIVCETISDTPYVGDKIADQSFLEQFIGVDKPDFTVDAISGSTISSKSVVRAVLEAMKAHGMEVLYKEVEKPSLINDQTVLDFTAEIIDEVDNGDGSVTYTVAADGYAAMSGGARNEYLVSVNTADQSIKSISCKTFSDTPHLGDAAITDEFFAQFVGVKAEKIDIDIVSGATFTSKSAVRAVLTALAK